MLNKRTIPSVCVICGKSFMAFSTSKGRPGGGRFCSRSCAARNPIAPPHIRFWARIDKDGPLPTAHPEFGNCWIQRVGLATDGYGRFRNEGRIVQSQRWAWSAANGVPIPDGLIILHTCDVRNCVRNDEPGIYIVGGKTLPRYGHLALGTYEDNAIDASEKGIAAAGAYRRHALKPESYRRGDQHQNAAFTDDMVRQIRERYRNGGITHLELAQEYGVSLTPIKSLLDGKTYQTADGGSRIPAPAANLHRWGEHIGNAALTNAQAEEIRRLKTEGRSQKSLAQQFGVSQSTISNVLLGLRYQQSTR